MILKNATALITGGAQGLGKGFAKAILELGGKVSILDIRNEVGLNTQNEFVAQFGPGSVLFIKCDVQKKEELEGAFEKTKNVFGSLDVVVNNAGVVTRETGNWERTININLNAVLRGSMLAVEYMSKSKGGRGGQIINIASTAGLTPVPLDLAYVASKSGVVNMSRSLAMKMRDEAVQVKCLCPSFTDTEIMQQIDSFAPESEKAFHAKIIKEVGLMKVDDVVAAFKALLTDEDGNGSVMHVTPKGYSYRYKGKPSPRL